MQVTIENLKIIGPFWIRRYLLVTLHHMFVVNKISFITTCLQFLELDINQLSYLLNYDGFEALIQEMLSRNNYRTIKNFRFSDRSPLKYETSQKKYEIDVIGIYQSFILIIDAKQWKRKDSYGAMNKAANLQYQRVVALKDNPEIISSLISIWNKHYPLTIYEKKEQEMLNTDYGSKDQLHTVSGSGFLFPESVQSAKSVL